MEAACIVFIYIAKFALLRRVFMLHVLHFHALFGSMFQCS